MQNYRTRLIIGAIIAIIAVIGYFMKTEKNPVTGEKQKVSLTIDQEIRLGIQSAPEMIEQFGGEYPDRRQQNYLDQIGARILSATEGGSSPYKFDFHLLADEKTV